MRRFFRRSTVRSHPGARRPAPAPSQSEILLNLTYTVWEFANFRYISQALSLGMDSQSLKGMGGIAKQIVLGLVFVLASIIALPAGANIKAIKDNSRRKPAGVIQRESRIEHARELLGKHYSRSTVRSGEKIKKINARIYD